MLEPLESGTSSDEEAAMDGGGKGTVESERSDGGNKEEGVQSREGWRIVISLCLSEVKRVPGLRCC